MEKNNDKSRLARVETRVEGIKEDLDSVREDVKDILTNHLPHLREEISSNKLKIALIAGAAAFLGSKAVDIVSNLIK